MIEKLIQSSARPDVTNQEGDTPILYCFRFLEGAQLENILNILLAASSVESLRTGANRHAVFVACQKRHWTAVPTLLTARADPNGGINSTPIHVVIASAQRELEVQQ